MNARQTLVLIILFSMFVIYGTTIPFDFSSLSAASEKIHTVSLNPFFTIEGNRVSFSDVIQNILLFIPLGFLGGIFVHSIRMNLSTGTIAVVSFGMILSVSVEALQLFAPSRTTSLTDVCTNTSGTFIGALSYLAVRQYICKIRDIPVIKELSKSNAFYPLLLLSILIMVEILQPFDFALDVGTIYSKVKFVLQHPFTINLSLRDDIFVFTIYCLLGFLASRCTLSLLVHFRAGFIVAMLIFPIVLEMVQFIVCSRSPEFGDAALASASLITGLFLSKPLKHHETIAVILLLLSYLSSLFCKLFYPFVFTSHTGFNIIPFSSEYANTTMISLGNTFETFTLFAFGGYLLSVSLQKLNIKQTQFVIISTTFLIIVAEYSQGWVEGRFADSSDIITAIVSLFCGIYLFHNKAELMKSS
jgi:glycopeptide antibiotics resistance protein